MVDDPPSEGSHGFKQGDLGSEPADFDTAMDGTTATNEEENEEELNDFWSYMKAKMKAAMEWAHGVVQSLSGSGKTTDKGDES